jgi:hypothetical protein
MRTYTTTPAAVAEPAATPATCLHCCRAPVSRPRGLCWVCFYQPRIREQYAPLGAMGRHGARRADTRRERPLGEPTEALPGTPQKVAVLIARASAGLALWHPEDATHPWDGDDGGKADDDQADDHDDDFDDC